MLDFGEEFVNLGDCNQHRGAFQPHAVDLLNWNELHFWVTLAGEQLTQASCWLLPLCNVFDNIGHFFHKLFRFLVSKEDLSHSVVFIL